MANTKLKPGQAGRVSCQQLPNGKFIARRRFRMTGGYVKPISATGNTEDEAREALFLKTMALQRHKGGTRDLNAQSTLATAAEQWFVKQRELAAKPNPKRSLSTINKYENDFRLNILPRAGDLSLYEIDTDFCEAMLEDIADSKSNAAARASGIVLSLVFQYAISKDAVEKNPMATAETRKYSSPEVEILPIEALANIRQIFWNKELLALETRGPGSKNGGQKPTFHVPVMFDLILGTAARSGEVLGLRWENIIEEDGKPAVEFKATVVMEKDADGKEQMVHQPWLKGGDALKPKHRIVFLPPSVVKALNYIKPEDAEPTDFVFEARDFQNRGYSLPHLPRNVRISVGKMLDGTPYERPKKGAEKIAESDDTAGVTEVSRPKGMPSKGAPAGLSKKAPRSFHWHMLRKLVSTRVKAEYGLEASQRILGHFVKGDDTVAMRHYIEKPIVTPDVTDVTEALFAELNEIAPVIY